MANRIAGNIYIIDSQTNAVGVPWLDDAYVQTIAFWGADTSAVLELAMQADTTNVIARFSVIDQAVGATPTGSALLGVPNYIYLGGVKIGQITVKTLTAGTGWIYFK